MSRTFHFVIRKMRLATLFGSQPMQNCCPLTFRRSSDNLRAASHLRAQSPVGQSVDAPELPVDAAGQLKRVEHRAQLLPFRHSSAVPLPRRQHPLQRCLRRARDAAQLRAYTIFLHPFDRGLLQVHPQPQLLPVHSMDGFHRGPRVIPPQPSKLTYLRPGLLLDAGMVVVLVRSPRLRGICSRFHHPWCQLMNSHPLSESTPSRRDGNRRGSSPAPPAPPLRFSPAAPPTPSMRNIGYV